MRVVIFFLNPCYLGPVTSSHFFCPVTKLRLRRRKQRGVTQASMVFTQESGGHKRHFCPVITQECGPGILIHTPGVPAFPVGTPAMCIVISCPSSAKNYQGSLPKADPNYMGMESQVLFDFHKDVNINMIHNCFYGIPHKELITERILIHRALKFN